MDRDEWKTTVRRMVGRLIQATDEHAMAREAVKRAESTRDVSRAELEEFLLANPIPAEDESAVPAPSRGRIG